MIETLATGQRKIRKAHQCYACYRPIPKGTVCQYGTFKYDYVYTLYHHPDCYAAEMDYVKHLDWYDLYDGIQPLKDMISDSGEWQKELDRMRGHYPHVVCRLEFAEQACND